MTTTQAIRITRDLASKGFDSRIENVTSIGVEKRTVAVNPASGEEIAWQDYYEAQAAVRTLQTIN
jgi:hypothetical protein